MLHRFAEGGAGPGSAIEDRLQESQLAFTVRSRAAMTALAENYVGLPRDFFD